MRKDLKYGTHNSGTSGKLVWWERIFSPLLNLTSRCQDKSIDEQLSDGIILFNFQICYYKHDWHFSHGLCIYEDMFINALNSIFKVLDDDKDKKIYIKLSLDKNFLLGQDIERYKDLVSSLSQFINEYYNNRLILISAIIEGSDILYKDESHGLSYSENYWSLGWAKLNKGLFNFLPLPRYHAKKYNCIYKEYCDKDVLMLDFYDIN